MADTLKFDDARRRLDQALELIAADQDDRGAAAPAVDDRPGPSPDADGPPELPLAAQAAGQPGSISLPSGGAQPPPPGGEPVGCHAPPGQTSELLTRLIIGAAVLGADAIAARSGVWELQAAIEPGPAAAGEGAHIPVRDQGDARFRHGLIGWIFETEEELRPGGNPLQWLRRVVSHLFGSVFSVVFDSLPRLGPRRRRDAVPISDQDTARWVARGQHEEPRSRAFAAAALDDIVNQAIPYLARRQGVQQAVAELVRSPAMDDAIVTLARRQGVQQAVAELVRSPVIGEALTAIVRSPEMEGAITHIVSTQAMDEALATLSRSPALVQLVQTQSTSIIGEIVEEVRERGEAVDDALEGLARRLLRRTPRAQLPLESRGLMVVEPSRRGGPASKP